jgi:hypothetical protein
VRHRTLGRSPWTSDQPYADTSSWQHTTLTRERYSCLRWDSNQPTHALDRAAIGIGPYNFKLILDKVQGIDLNSLLSDFGPLPIVFFINILVKWYKDFMSQNYIILQRVPDQCNITGNEKSDALTKKVTLITPTTYRHIPHRSVTNAIRRSFKVISPQRMAKRISQILERLNCQHT